MIKKIVSLLYRAKLSLLNFYTKPNKNAIWIFGFQKSGTSAIAGLLAERTNKSVTIDSIYLWQPYKAEMDKRGITHHVNKYSLDFSKDIIKEPGATFYIPTIESYFRLEQYVFIIRNPFDNIRSILNRLGVPGDQEEISLEDINYRWRHKFKNEGKNYIQDLAELWMEANNQRGYMENARCVLVKYEDFVQDKISFIDELAENLDLKIVNDISNIINKPFQPKGRPHTDLKLFFGQKNIDIIIKICGGRMEELGYNINEILKP